MDGKQYFCVKNILIIIMVVLYLLFINREMLHKITNIEFRTDGPYILFDVFVTIANIVLWYYLLQNIEAHRLISTINPLTIALIVTISYVVYDEKITRNEMVGILLVLLGIIFINKK